MTTTPHDALPASASEPPRTSTGRRSLQIALAMAIVIGVFYVLREHWNHIAGNWVYLLLLACPVMHLFHGHGGHAHTSSRSADKET